MKIKFKRDTSFRKNLFTPDSFAHPAKMDAQLLIWLTEKYTKVGETILDPMAGSGTAMLACTIGRNVILVELEQKFVGMQEANWGKVKMMPQLGYTMGECKILQGDARNLEGLSKEPKCLHGCQRHYYKFNDKCMHCGHKRGELVLVDGIITSPPYAAAQSGGGIAQEGYTKDFQKDKIGGGNLDPVGKRSYMPENVGSRADNISRLPYGSIDSVITSPPFQSQKVGGRQGAGKYSGTDLSQGINRVKDDYAGPDNPSNIGNLDYGNIDSIITSPPYEEAHDKKIGGLTDKDRPDLIPYSWVKSDNEGNIGNLKGDTYLSAMLQVYQQCHKVLKPQGLMILVTKNFIRDRKEVHLDEDTIRLCGQAGFKFVERHYRKLPAQSFWRVIYKRKYPDAPVLDKEDILVFRRTGDSNG